MRALARGIDLYLDLEDLAQEWLAVVAGPDLSQEEAVLALCAALKGALSPPDQTP